MTDRTHTRVTVAELPDCDICKHYDRVITPAAYDGKTTQGPWAYMCQGCFTSCGVGLGLGKGQRLVIGE